MLRAVLIAIGTFESTFLFFVVVVFGGGRFLVMSRIGSHCEHSNRTDTVLPDQVAYEVADGARHVSLTTKPRRCP